MIDQRAFTDPRNTAADVGTMDGMLRWLRGHIASLPAQPTRRDDRFVDPVDGAHHTVIVTDVPAASMMAPLTAVGFFGQARQDVDHAPIVELEQRLIADMAGPPGPIVYHNVWWPGEGWGNLVLFASLADEMAWGRADPLHIESVRRAPAHYHSIRLHTGVVEDGLSGVAGVRLLRTKYLDYGASPPWRLVQEATGT